MFDIHMCRYVMIGWSGKDFRFGSFFGLAPLSPSPSLILRKNRAKDSTASKAAVNVTTYSLTQFYVFLTQFAVNLFENTVQIFINFGLNANFMETLPEDNNISFVKYKYQSHSSSCSQAKHGLPYLIMWMTIDGWEQL